MGGGNSKGKRLAAAEVMVTSQLEAILGSSADIASTILDCMRDDIVLWKVYKESANALVSWDWDKYLAYQKVQTILEDYAMEPCYVIPDAVENSSIFDSAQRAADLALRQAAIDKKKNKVTAALERIADYRNEFAASAGTIEGLKAIIDINLDGVH